MDYSIGANIHVSIYPLKQMKKKKRKKISKVMLFRDRQGQKDKKHENQWIGTSTIHSLFFFIKIFSF